MRWFMPVAVVAALFLMSCSGKQEQRKYTGKQGDSSLSVMPLNRSVSVVRHDYSYRDLSDEFTLQVHFKSYRDTAAIYDSATVSVMVTGKYNPQLSDTLSLTAMYYADAFQDSNHVVSYSTNVNTNKPVVDNYPGDIVIADLNFDNLDDIAIISDGGGNGGPLYNYYLQNGKGKFIRDAFLTDSMMFFPSKINRRRKTLTTRVHAGACCVSKTVYHFDETRNKWITKSHVILRQ